MTASAAQDRVAAFEEQMLAWLAQARPGVPTFVLPDATTAKSGLCISCGTNIETGWRCPLCLEAVNCVIREFNG